jgi:glycosyltransferase involved in cell wall biosynthesis
MIARTVLYLHTTSEVGGSDVSLTRLVEGLDPTKYRAIVVLPSDGPLVQRLRAAGADVQVMTALWKLTSRRGWWYLVGFVLNFPRAVWRLRQLIRRERVALVHTNTIHNLYGAPAARLARVPHVWHIREIVWQKGWLRRLEVWMARRWSTRIIVTSEAVAAMFGPPSARPSQLTLVSNGIETDRFHPGDAPDVRTALGVSEGECLVGLVCRLDVWKGAEVFIDAAARVARQRPTVRFVIVGGPIIGLESYAASVVERADAAGLGDRLVFTHWTYGPDRMPDVHRALDVLVLASTEAEPFGLVVIEAMASGRPVIATAHGGPIDIVVDGVTGVLIPPKDAEAMAAAIVSLADDRAKARAMGAAGRERAVAHYSSDAYRRGVFAVYDAIVGTEAH